MEKVVKDRDALLAFFDFPAEHWIHLKTTDERIKRLTLVCLVAAGE
ncbi:MAG TPA: hypothetical protein VMU76_00885 [Acidimicrobiales bacterium]|nr:hypothetical protein [Acidimicrobiales bacterium]